MALKRFLKTFGVISLLFQFTSLKAQTVYTFVTAGATGENGPTQTQANSVYNFTNLAGQVQVINGIQYWEVPLSGFYTIEAIGGQGYGAFGGRGASIAGDFFLHKGDTLKILVGQKAGHYNSYPATTYSRQYGGGGGSFITKTDNTPYIVAGGGGGNHASSYSVTCDGQLSTSGGAGTNGVTNGNGGTNGSGGQDALKADGGGGLLGNGVGNTGGSAFVNGGAGGYQYGRGGFGGGGGTWSWPFHRCGGGGGYSGGGASNNELNCCPTAGGGGSFNAGANQVNIAGVGLGDGQVVVKKMAVVPNDAAVLDIVEPNDTCVGNYDVKAVIANLGNNQLASVQINWSINGIPQSPFAYNLLLDTVNGVNPFLDTVTIGNIGLSSVTMNNIVVWTSLPNGSSDLNPINDTISKSTIGYAYPIVDLGKDTSICPNTVALLQGGAIYDSLRWSTNQTTPTIIASNPGSYSVRVYENGCESRDTIQISLNPPPPIVTLPPDTTFCQGDSLILDATTAGVSYKWSDNSTGPKITAKLPKLYWVQIEDANQCTNSDSIVINLLPKPDILLTVSPSSTICHGDPVTFTAYPTTAGSILYQWRHNGNNSGSPIPNNKFSPNVSNEDSISVELITDVCVKPNEQVISNSIVMNVNPPPNSIIGKDEVIHNSTQVYSINAKTGSSYKWKAEGGIIPGTLTGDSVTVQWGAVNSLAKISCVETRAGCSYNNRLPVNIVSIVGINESKERISMGNAYPNPAQTTVTIPLLLEGQWEINLELFDITGKRIKSIFNGELNGNKELTFNTEDLENGLYLYRVTTSNGYSSSKRITIHR